MTGHNQRKLDELVAQMTWNVAELGIAEGLSGREGENFADFTRFVEGSYIPLDKRDDPTYTGAVDWSELPPEDVRRFSKWLPRG